MAAGIVYHDMTTATGVTFSVGGWVPDTAAPNVGFIPIHALFGTNGTELALATAAKQDTIISYTSRLLSSASNIAAGSALATTSFMVGARYNSTPPTFTNGQEGGLQIDAAGRLLISGTISGAGDASAANQVSANTKLDSIIAKQPALGTAGTSSADIITIQGRAAMTPILATATVASGGVASGAFAAGAMVDLLTMRGTKAPGTAAANSILAGGVYNSTPPTLTDGQQASAQFDAAGNLKITGAAAGTEYVEDAAAAANPSGGMTMLRRLDTPLNSTVSADGDNSAWQGNAYGAGYVVGMDKNGSLSDYTVGSEIVGDVAHDAVGTSVNPVAVGGYASAAAPTDVSADGDIARKWVLRNGALATVITAAGALIGGDAANGLDVDVTRVAADPFGLNADAASATGSISAKLRFIAATGIPITGTVTVGSHAVTNAGTFAVQAAIADGADVTQGVTTGAKVVTDANGTIQQYMRGLVTFFANSLGAGTAAAAQRVTLSSDGPGVAALGVITDAAVITDSNGSLQQYLRGLIKGRTIKTASGSLTADTDVIAAVTSKRIKVIAYSMTTTGTNGNAAIFKSNGTSGTELWRVFLQGATGVPYGVNLATSAPSFLFATVAGEKLTLDVGNADTVHYSIAYFDDDAA